MTSHLQGDRQREWCTLSSYNQRNATCRMAMRPLPIPLTRLHRAQVPLAAAVPPSPSAASPLCCRASAAQSNFHRQEGRRGLPPQRHTCSRCRKVLPPSPASHSATNTTSRWGIPHGRPRGSSTRLRLPLRGYRATAVTAAPAVAVVLSPVWPITAGKPRFLRAASLIQQVEQSCHTSAPQLACHLSQHSPMGPPPP